MTCWGTLINAGDFDCVLDRELDRTNSESDGAKKTVKSKDSLRRMIGSQMVDSYRRLHPLGISYTFTGSNGYRARLDRIYIEEEIAGSLDKVFVQAVTCSDHDLVSISLGKENPRKHWGQGSRQMDFK